MFERFTSECRQVVQLAQEEANRMRHPAIGTEHLLLGILETGPNVAAQALAAHGIETADVRRRVLDIVGDPLDPDSLATLGIDLAAVRQAAEASFGPGALDPKAQPEPTWGHRPLTNRAKKVLELALREAMRLKHKAITPGHLLLGLVREGHGIAARVLTEAGVKLDDLRAELVRLLAAEAA